AAASELVIVGDAVLAPRVVSKIHHPDVNEPGGARAPHDRLRDRRLHDAREQRHDVDPQRRDSYSSSRPSGGRITTRRASTSTSTTIPPTAGIKCSRPAARTIQRS